MGEVKIWEERIVIPTYEVGEPDKNPMFLEKRVYQGSSGKVYPYPTTEKISRVKTDKEYQAVFLENEYIKVMILPESATAEPETGVPSLSPVAQSTLSVNRPVESAADIYRILNKLLLPAETLQPPVTAAPESEAAPIRQPLK